MRPEALDALKGSDLILHAGDIGGPEVLTALAALAPVTAVRGNNDQGPWAERLPGEVVITAGCWLICLIHDRKQLKTDPERAGYAAVVAGHSHQPGQRKHNRVLDFNPGSAGPRRFRLPIAVGKLHVTLDGIEGEIVEL